MSEPSFSMRAVEVHSFYAWDFAWMKKVMKYISDLGFNTLIVHRNDIVENLEYPGKIFGFDEKNGSNSIFDVYAVCYKKIFKYTPTRRSSIFNRNAYFRRILEEAERRNIDVYVENKELFFPDILPELKPELIRDGHVCPTDPYWLEYIECKFKEFFHYYPGVKGVITSIATSESKISIKNNRCHCVRCSSTSPEEWYRSILNKLYEVMNSLGKELIVRDFVFDSSSQREISAVMEELPEDVIISLKNTPHDYYPTFPVNQRIGHVGKHRQWVEFDTMGQYFGMGVGVADLTEDYRLRMKDAMSKGADGVIFRTDWESFDSQSTFITPNLINLYSAGKLSLDVDINADDIYRSFASREGWNDSNLNATAEWLRRVYEKTWSVTKKTVFADSCVFSDSSTLPVSVNHAVWLAEEKNSLKDWDSSKKDSISPLKSSVERIMKEKKRAKEELNSIISLFDCIPESVNRNKAAWLKKWMKVNEIYLEEFTLAAEGVLSARYISESEEDDEAYMIECRKKLRDCIEKLNILAGRLKLFWKETDFNEHVVYTLLDPERVECLGKDLSRYLEM